MNTAVTPQATASARPGRLETFAPPRPNPFLIRALVPVNRVLCLGGVPLLRSLPVTRQVPGLRGLSDIVRIDLPRDHEQRLRDAVDPRTATFLTPNHPEFFTDWMLDKEVMARVAPLAACWATHVIVNGMGPIAQGFWLRNNLIAQIPGAGGRDGRTYSVEWALKGHGVLLHPEGTVGWHGDTIGPLFPGAVEMAIEAAAMLERDGRAGRALVSPLVWKLKFLHDVEPRLQDELGYVERRLAVTPGPRARTPAERVAGIYEALLARDEQTWLGERGSGDSFAERQRRLVAAMADRLVQLLALEAAAGQPDDARPFWRAPCQELLRAADRQLRKHAGEDRAATDEARRLVKDLRRLTRFRPELYPNRVMTQEQVAENIKRLRSDYCRGSLRDTLGHYVPRPAGPRVALVRVPEPMDVTSLLAGRGVLSDAEIALLVADLRGRMQGALDAIEQEWSASPRRPVYDNPFAE
jgi:hypothetical protein